MLSRCKSYVSSAAKIMDCLVLPAETATIAFFADQARQNDMPAYHPAMIAAIANLFNFTMSEAEFFYQLMNTQVMHELTPAQRNVTCSLAIISILLATISVPTTAISFSMNVTGIGGMTSILLGGLSAATACFCAKAAKNALILFKEKNNHDYLILNNANVITPASPLVPQNTSTS